MSNVFHELKERGFVQQVTHEQPIIDLLGSKQVTFYIGFDPTVDSLTAGNLMGIMLLGHMQRAGHRPIALLGGGTAMIPDPTGKTELRKILTQENIAANAECFKGQIGRVVDFSNDRALMVNNADWLLGLNYVEFLREIGMHFSVNRMLTADCFRTRLERGLSFIEFNYMLLQSYDFLHLFRQYGCQLQMGGDDQWSNIISGADLIRRLESGEAFGLTTPLITLSNGQKMGKSESGAIWLDPKRTSPFEFYQYWRNTPDADVERFLGIFTFLPMDEVRRLGALRDREINDAKKVLAFEVTKMMHGEEEAVKAQQAAEALFSGGVDESAVPTSEIPQTELEAGIGVTDLLVRTGLAASKGEGRRLIEQGGLVINGEKVTSIERVVTMADLDNGRVALRKGKKGFLHVRVI